MHKKFVKLFAFVLVMMVITAAALYAANVYDRSVVTLGTTTGSAVYTNVWKYSALELKRIWVENPLVSSNNVTVNRISADGVYTQSCGTISVRSGAGNTASFTAAYLKYGDKLAFASDISTGATVMVEYEVQQ